MAVDAATRRHYMHLMGIPVWVPKAAVPETVSPVAFVPSDDTQDVVGGKAVEVSAETACVTLPWEGLEQVVRECSRCGLAKTRTQTVFGTGDRQAAWMVVGEAPGADEDRQGEPFVGRAGQLLNQMLLAIGLQRQQVYIANVLKCRPPNNRDPKPEEVAQCRGYLERQITLVNPRLILVVGRIAAHHLLQTNAPLARLRGEVHTYPLTQTPVVVTYHPAYLLRQPADKRKAWQDLLFARTVFARAVA